MAASLIIKHDTDGSIQLSDGAATPVTFTAPFTQGDLSITGLDGNGFREVVRYQTRGVHHSTRLGARTYPTITFSAMLADVSDGTDQTLYDWLRKTGAYASNTTTSSNSQEVYVFDLVLTIEGTDHGDGSDHTLTITEIDGTFDIAEGQPNTISFSGTVNGTVTGA